MNITIKTTNFKLTNAIREYVENKLKSLYRHSGKLQIARIELEFLETKHTGEKYRAEATVDAPHATYRAESTMTDLYASIDTLIPKIVTQIEKNKEKSVSKNRKAQRELKAQQ